MIVGIRPIYKRSMDGAASGAVLPGDEPPIPMIYADFPPFGPKSVHPSAKLPPTQWLLMVIDLNVRRNQPQCSNFALNVRTHQSHCDSCRSKGGRCQGTDGNSPYIFSAEKCTFIIKYSKVWKWCRTFNAIFFDLNVRHLT